MQKQCVAQWFFTSVKKIKLYLLFHKDYETGTYNLY